MTIDDLDNHLPSAGDMAAAATPMGWYLAWCVNMHLVSPAFAREFEQAILRIRYREDTGAHLVVAAGGKIAGEYLTAAGLSFTRDYYPQYLDDLRAEFASENLYQLPDDWPHYERVARMLTARYMAVGGSRNGGGETKPVWSAIKRWFGG